MKKIIILSSKELKRRIHKAWQSGYDARSSEIPVCDSVAQNGTRCIIDRFHYGPHEAGGFAWGKDLVPRPDAVARYEILRSGDNSILRPTEPYNVRSGGVLDRRFPVVGDQPDKIDIQ